MFSKVRLMDAREIPVAAAALSNAFFTDPFQNYTFPDANVRREVSPAHFSAALKAGSMFGEVYIADNGEGASIWLKPGATDITPEQAEAAGFNTLPEEIGIDAFQRFFGIISFMEEFHHSDAAMPHWYTMVLGVDPVYQGRGFGKALLQPNLDRAKADGVPVYLETTQPKNVSFYKKMGFDLIRELNEPTSGLDVWTFRLDP